MGGTVIASNLYITVTFFHFFYICQGQEHCETKNIGGSVGEKKRFFWGGLFHGFFVVRFIFCVFFYRIFYYLLGVTAM